MYFDFLFTWRVAAADASLCFF